MPKNIRKLHEFRVLLAISTIALTVLLISFGPSMAQLYEAKLDRPGFLMTNVSLSNALVSGRTGERNFSYPAAMQEFYGTRFNQPYWLSNSGPYTRARVFAERLEKAWQHGLNPERYHAAEIRVLMESSRVEDHAQLELLLTDAFILYARDLSGIRIDPGISRFLDRASWRKPMDAEGILPLLATDQSIVEILTSIEPRGATYKRLQEELARLVAEPEEPWAGVVPISFGNILMKPGWRHKSVPDLRLRLGAVQQTQDALLYDDALAAAVMKFQQENSLRSDGIIGSNTLQALNRTKQGKIEQIVANLERLRWVDERKPEKFVVVNIPSYTLWAVDKGKVEFEMEVVVGKPVRPTQSFIAQINGVRFNPDWTVPPTIKKHDILPKVIEDPDYLTNKGIELIRGRGAERETLDPSAVDWENISWKELNAIQMVQVPGAHNPLGQIRVLMPNEYNIYLHDTNHPEHFGKPERAESSGCIRMQEPRKMAEFLMQGHEGWGPGSLAAKLARAGTDDVMISAPIAVYVLYYTVWTDENGKVVYGNDIYNLDGKIVSALAALDGFRIPAHNKKILADAAPATPVSLR